MQDLKIPTDLRSLIQLANDAKKDLDEHMGDGSCLDASTERLDLSGLPYDPACNMPDYKGIVSFAVADERGSPKYVLFHDDVFCIHRAIRSKSGEIAWDDYEIWKDGMWLDFNEHHEMIVASRLADIKNHPHPNYLGELISLGEKVKNYIEAKYKPHGGAHQLAWGHLWEIRETLPIPYDRRCKMPECWDVFSCAMPSDNEPGWDKVPKFVLRFVGGKVSVSRMKGDLLIWQDGCSMIEGVKMDD